MISPNQFAAGERLRADFTRGNLTPRVTSNWSAPTGGRGSGAGACEMTDLIVAARQRVRLALDAGGVRTGIFRPSDGRLLLLRVLEDVERERGWPPRSAKSCCNWHWTASEALRSPRTCGNECPRADVVGKRCKVYERLERFRAKWNPLRMKKTR